MKKIQDQLCGTPLCFLFLEVIKIVRKILLSISLKIFFCLILFLANTGILMNIYFSLFDEDLLFLVINKVSLLQFFAHATA